MTAHDMIWIGYTTLYREGGVELERAARTMERTLCETRPETVRCQAIESKAGFLNSMSAVAEDGYALKELHFLGHSGMYGPMFGSVAWPEQFSPHEWREIQLPFAEGGEAFFHACRTARWFAPFFANTVGVPTHGYHWYTTFSKRPDLFRWPGRSAGSKEDPLYLVGCPGRRSHGWFGSVKKYSGLMSTEEIKRFDPVALDGDPSYDSVADLYDEVFSDIRVRHDEWSWMKAHMPEKEELSLLDIGCGNGAFLRALSEDPDVPSISRGVGVDRSAHMVEIAGKRSEAFPALKFEHIANPRLPFEDHSFDIVTSLLSMRYLDWDPVFGEIRRVLKPGGKILIVDMVTDPLQKGDIPRLLKDKVRAQLQRWRNRHFSRALKILVGDPRWQTMLKYNPIRSEHEMKWFLESRFPDRALEILNLGLYSRVVAFDTGALEPGDHEPLSYP
jgi:ubiquinone/menaquinone biosynthesis C-methylase UbiE